VSAGVAVAQWPTAPVSRRRSRGRSAGSGRRCCRGASAPPAPASRDQSRACPGGTGRPTGASAPSRPGQAGGAPSSAARRRPERGRGSGSSTVRRRARGTPVATAGSSAGASPRANHSAVDSVSQRPSAAGTVPRPARRRDRPARGSAAGGATGSAAGGATGSAAGGATAAAAARRCRPPPVSSGPPDQLLPGALTCRPPVPAAYPPASTTRAPTAPAAPTARPPHPRTR